MSAGRDAAAVAAGAAAVAAGAAAVAAGAAELGRLLEATAITLLTLTEGGTTLTLRRDAGGTAAIAPAPTLAAAAPAAAGPVVTAPCPGVFLLRHPLRDAPLAVPGAAVAAGAVLGLLRAGPLLIEVAAPQAGILRAVEAAEGSLVGYGTPLFGFHAETEDD